jgi:hypothetical protein
VGELIAYFRGTTSITMRFKYFIDAFSNPENHLRDFGIVRCWQCVKNQRFVPTVMGIDTIERQHMKMNVEI